MSGMTITRRGDAAERSVCRCEFARTRALPPGMVHPRSVHIGQSLPVGEIGRGLAGVLANWEGDPAAAMTAGQSRSDPLVVARKRLAELEREMSNLETNMLAGLVSDRLRALCADLKADRASLHLASRATSAPTAAELTEVIGELGGMAEVLAVRATTNGPACTTCLRVSRTARATFDLWVGSRRVRKGT